MFYCFGAIYSLSPKLSQMLKAASKITPLPVFSSSPSPHSFLLPVPFYIFLLGTEAVNFTLHSIILLLFLQFILNLGIF